jgi:hypothetical protein
VKLNWKLVLVTVSAALALATSGCGGINGSQSVSPASFFLPGLIRAKPQPADPTVPLPELAPGVQVAQAR